MLESGDDDDDDTGNERESARREKGMDRVLASWLDD